MLMEHGPEVDLVVKVSTFRCHIGLLLYEYKIMQSSLHTKVSHYVQKHSVHSTYEKGGMYYNHAYSLQLGFASTIGPHWHKIPFPYANS